MYTSVYTLDFFSSVGNFYSCCHILCSYFKTQFRLPVLNVGYAPATGVGNSKYYINKTIETTQSIDEVLCTLIFP